MTCVRHSLDRLYALRTFGIKPGLETTEALLDRLGNPQQAFAAIHVAGTNGKGSVCAMLEAVFRGSGLAIGLYTSPHLVRFNERIRVDGEPITDDELAALFEVMEPHASAVAATGREATFFEFTTALAFEHFRRRGVKLAVVETGLGGRLDSTNILVPLVSVITRIGLEHTAYLGTTLEAIAGEKAGIIKPGRPVVCGATPEEALRVIRGVAAERGAPWSYAPEAVTVRRVAQDLGGQKVAIETAEAGYGSVTLPLIGKHQLENCATAVAALEAVAACSPVRLPPALVLKGLGKTRWPGRLQVLSTDPPVLLDGAHNPDGARTLAAAIRELLKHRPVGLVWGMCDDKDAPGFAKALGALVKRCWVVPIASERSHKPGTLKQLAATEGWPVEVASVPGAVAAAQRWARETGGGVCIAGSLFLAGEVLEREGEWR